VNVPDLGLDIGEFVTGGQEERDVCTAEGVWGDVHDCPAPRRRTYPGSNRTPATDSLIPRPTVSSEIPVARATAAIPPRPHARRCRGYGGRRHRAEEPLWLHQEWGHAIGALTDGVSVPARASAGQRFFATLKLSPLLRWLKVARPAAGDVAFQPGIALPAPARKLLKSADAVPQSMLPLATV
jgi:hypothetical protein